VAKAACVAIGITTRRVNVRIVNEAVLQSSTARNETVRTVIDATILAGHVSKCGCAGCCSLAWLVEFDVIGRIQSGKDSIRGWSTKSHGNDQVGVEFDPSVAVCGSREAILRDERITTVEEVLDSDRSGRMVDGVGILLVFCLS